MEKVVVDASALIKWFVNEEQSLEMRKVRDMHILGRLKICVPSLIFLELGNAFRFSNATEKDVIDALDALNMIGLEVKQIDELTKPAIKIAFTLGLTLYDALYVALAEQLDSYIITYDKQILNKYDKAIKGSDFVNSRI
ncbi:hypothetical protein B9Q13_02015 [Candidatus Marsarchaeota G2 archaeon ECH_B_SAG-G16]|jgi:predicted nucleic acid-binding protein|uniref:PIN domain-containing protein n=5 Tax=Candidatus Marsarchaeota TaxID=1978152 RepID=A0A2R6AFP1_9ARCH|nr:MAG: hypothetical protein B9Q01_01670 [Candidatus Marsarchaeota G1 archaeon OSP_D]PSN85148.1 MAG: hypothetical protein B9Q02_07435 [Candidatus Marsarchaeota G1 archaeon BE_D]PSN89355.1 MAG: hypothetical protein B9Q00_01710 [Candidatus Marsarchaeota G1 archaeon OSP_C]PSN96925.1 MAG: hypothetical protein B9P99_00020 [Candidatus Marsarchaeota G1 archaeon OSP_B]PSO05395.1 MAG: hypothetical protein B9Q13_02015 [Candidatus Marsarchaeota G2 archaeon ECH_B_SAG-G16]